MKIERLRKSHKKEIVIGGLIAICLLSAITFVGTRAKYKTTESIKLVEGTVNYKVPDLRVVAIKTSEDGTNYTDVAEVPTSGYKLNTTNSVCKVATETSGIENAPKDNDITIEYSNGLINFIGLTKKNTRCYLYFDKVNDITIPDIIAANNPKSETPDFTKAATTDEGVYAVSDGMYSGTSYYWRGAVENNYVKFADFCWRIIRINGDGTMRLIYDGATCHANGTSTTDSLALQSQAYNENFDRSEYVGYTYEEGSQRTTNGTASNLKNQTDTWYTNNLASYAERIADGKFCNDREVAEGYTWESQPESDFHYAGYDRSGAKDANIVTPTLSCPDEDVYILKAGLITMDEVVMAGGKTEALNSSYYLNSGNYYWTMSPSYWNYFSSSSSNAEMFFVHPWGHLNPASVDSTSSGIRPVINLKADTPFTGGTDGTLDNPYVVQ